MHHRFSYEILEHIATLSESSSGAFALELNRIKYGSAAPKLDLRIWDKENGKMLRGVTLTADEARELKKALIKAGE